MKNNWQTVGAIIAIVISLGSLSFNFVGKNATEAEQLKTAKIDIAQNQLHISELQKPNAVVEQQIKDMQREMERQEAKMISLSELKGASIRQNSDLASVKESISRLADGLQRLETTQTDATKEQVKISVILESVVTSNNNVAKALKDMNDSVSAQDINMARLDQRLSQVEKEDDG